MYVAIQPSYKKGELDHFRVNLVNAGAEAVPFRYIHEHAGASVFDLQRELMPYSCFFLDTFKLEDLNDRMVLNFDIQQELDPFKSELRLKPKDLFKEPVFDEIVNGKVLAYSILPRQKRVVDPINLKEEDARKLKEQLMGGSSQKKEQASSDLYSEPELIIDLHIENLIADSSGMDNPEIIAVQMTTFQSSFDRAVNAKIPKLIVVHGVGKGKLKEEIFNFCKDNPLVQKYHNSHDHRFGFGATEIIFD
jgi:hypothetical protein